MRFNLAQFLSLLVLSGVIGVLVVTAIFVAVYVFMDDRPASVLPQAYFDIGSVLLAVLVFSGLARAGNYTWELWKNGSIGEAAKGVMAGAALGAIVSPIGGLLLLPMLRQRLGLEPNPNMNLSVNSVTEMTILGVVMAICFMGIGAWQAHDSED